MESDKTVTVSETSVACDGLPSPERSTGFAQAGGALGHPLVYLNLGEAGETECPYCGCRFKYDAGAVTGTGH